MKVRQGFVSNSSSSSFCLYGCQFDTTDITKDMLTDEAIKVLEEHQIFPEESDDDSLYEDAYEVLDYLGGGQICGEEGYFVAGECPWEMKADETRYQFELRIQSQVQKYFKDADEFEWHCEEYSC